MLFFSYDFVAKRLNHTNSTITSKLQTGEYDFVIEKVATDHVISSFAQQWVGDQSGLKPLNQNPEISIDLKDFKIIPTAHDELVISLKTKNNPDGRFKIEVSNQSSFLYYDSKELPLNVLSKPINLSGLDWTENPVNNSKQANAASWNELGALDGLVIRFYDISLDAFFIQNIAIYHKPFKINLKQLNGSDSQFLLTNSLRSMNATLLNSLGFSSLQAMTISELPVWVLLIAAWLTALFVMYLQNASMIRSYVLVSLVFGAITMVHQEWVAELEQYIKWPLLILVFGTVFAYRSVLTQVKDRASMVWVVSLLLALVLFLLNRKIEFVTSLPMYFIWAYVQQLLLGPLFSEYLYKHLKVTQWQCAALVGVLFSAIHAPNHILMIATLIGGVAWSYSWLKYKNIYANAFSHALLALLFYQAMPEILLNSARIGIFF